MIKYLNYKGEQLPIRVSYYALKMLKEAKGIALTSLKDDDFEAYETLLFYSLKRGHKLEDKPFTFTADQMEEIMDEVYFEFMAAIPDFFDMDMPKTTKQGEEVPDIEKK